MIFRSVTAAGRLSGCSLISQQDIDCEEQFIPPMCLQQSLDCIGVPCSGAMQPSKGTATPANITNTIDSESHRRIKTAYLNHVSNASDLCHIAYA